MADEKVLIQFDIDYGDSLAESKKMSDQLLNFREELRKNKAAQGELNHQSKESIQKGTATRESLKKDAQAMRKLELAELGTKDAITETNKMRKKSIDVMKIQENTLEGLRKQTSVMFKEREKLNTATKKGAKRFAELTAQLKKNSAQIRKADQAAGSFFTSIGKYPKILGSTVGKLAGMFGGFMLLTKGIKDAFKTIKDFETAIDKLQAVTKASDEEINLLREDAIRLGSSTSKTATQVAELQTEFAKLGFTTKDIRELTEATIDLSIAADSDLAQAAIIAGGTVRGFGLDVTETQRVVDVMAASFSMSALDIDKFKLSMAKVAPVAKNAGFSIERTTAMLGKLMDANIETSKAGTGLKNIFLELSVKGITLEDSLSKIKEATDKNKVAVELFGKENATVAIVLSETTDEVDKFTEALENSNGAAKEMAATMEDNLEGDLNKARSAWEGLILSIESGGGVITQVVRGITSGFTEFVNMMIMANKTADQIRLEQHLKSLGEQAKLDVEEFKNFAEGTDDITEASKRFLKVNREKLESLIKTREFFKDSDQPFISEDAQIEALETRIEAIQNYADKAAESEAKLLEQQKKINATKAEDQKAADEKRLERLESRNEAEKEIRDELNEGLETEFDDEIDEYFDRLDRKADAEREHAEEIKSIKQEVLDFGIQAVGLAGDAFLQGLDNEEQRINQSYDKRKKALDKQLKSGSITQEQFDKKSIELEKNKEMELYKIKKAQFDISRTLDLISIANNTATAVMKVWAQAGLGATFAQFLPIAAGAIQAGIVLSKDAPPAPVFAEGGDVKSMKIGGKSHAAGGVQFSGTDGTIFEAEKDEGIFITKRRATAEALSSINEKYGGRSFFKSAGRYYASGGSVVGSGADSQEIRQIVEQVLRYHKTVVKVEDIQTGLIDYNETINAGVVE